MMRRVAEKMLCEAEGRKKARRPELDVAGVVEEVEGFEAAGATRASRSGLGSSFVGTGLAQLILSARAYADGVAGVVHLR
jgi:hypothetical protein